MKDKIAVLIAKLSLIDWILIVIFLVGLMAVGVDKLWQSKVAEKEVVVTRTSEVKGETETRKIMVDIEGAVMKPGVYELSVDARYKDALAAAEGLSGKADRDYTEKYINLAEKLKDGQKIYIPQMGENLKATVNTTQGMTGAKINLNTASMGELDSLSGVGEVLARKIVEGRPYRTVEELVEKKILNKSVLEKNKERIAVF